MRRVTVVLVGLGALTVGGCGGGGARQRSRRINLGRPSQGRTTQFKVRSSVCELEGTV
jgi:hypothetical protein